MVERWREGADVVYAVRESRDGGDAPEAAGPRTSSTG